MITLPKKISVGSEANDNSCRSGRNVLGGPKVWLEEYAVRIATLNVRAREIINEPDGIFDFPEMDIFGLSSTKRLVNRLTD